MAPSSEIYCTVAASAKARTLLAGNTATEAFKKARRSVISPPSRCTRVDKAEADPVSRIMTCTLSSGCVTASCNSNGCTFSIGEILAVVDDGTANSAMNSSKASQSNLNLLRCFPTSFPIRYPLIDTLFKLGTIFQRPNRWRLCQVYVSSLLVA